MTFNELLRLKSDIERLTVWIENNNRASREQQAGVRACCGSDWDILDHVDAYEDAAKWRAELREKEQQLKEFAAQHPFKADPYATFWTVLVLGITIAMVVAALHDHFSI